MYVCLFVIEKNLFFGLVIGFEFDKLYFRISLFFRKNESENEQLISVEVEVN